MSARNEDIWKLCLQLLDNGRGWTQEAEARRGDGQPTDPLEDDATCFCLQGAVYRACRGDIKQIKVCLQDLRRALQSSQHPARDLLAFNDCPNTTFEDVAALYRMAATQSPKVETCD